MDDRIYEKLSRYNADSVELLSIQDIVDMHTKAIMRFGGQDGIRDKNLLISIVNSLDQEVFGQKLYPTIFDKAAKLLFDFANYQVFIDGNKRTGLIACESLLRINGMKLDITNEQAYVLVLDISNHRYDNYSDISDYLKQNY